MHRELLNLLPADRARRAKRDYFIRLGVVSLVALAGVVIASGALLVPTYLYVNQQVAMRQERIATLDSELGATQGKETSKRLAALGSTAGYLARLATTTTATAALRGVLATPRAGITLSGFTYAAPAGAAKGKMSVKGVAATRESLRAYNDALTALPFVSLVDLPISAYAKERDIPFVITLSGALTP